MNRSWKLVIGACLAIGCGAGLGLMSMLTQKAGAVAPTKKVETPWKDEFSNLKNLAVLVRKGSEALPSEALKLVGPLGDSLINTAKLAEKFAEVVETNQHLVVLQALECLVQSNRLLIEENKKFKKAGKPTSLSGCPEIGCVSKRSCMAVNVKLITELVKGFTDIVLGYVKENAEGKKVFVSGLLYNDVELFHNSVQAALSVNESLKLFPSNARALVDTYLLEPAAIVLKYEPSLARAIDGSLRIVGDILPLLIGGPDYIKQQKISGEDADKYLQRQVVIVDDPLVDFEKGQLDIETSK